MLLLLRGEPAGATPAEPEPVPYRAYVVDTNGTQLASLDFKGVVSVEWELNGPGSASFEFPTTHPDLLNVTPLESEVQVWRNGKPIWWGYIARPDADAERTRFQCRGLLGYFDRRFFGKADRTNLVSNPEFESDLTGWTTTGAGVTSAASTTRHIVGDKSAKLTQSSAGVDGYLHQTFNQSGGGIGVLLTFAAWFFIEEDGWVGPAFGNRGLYVQTTEAGTVRDVQFDPIENNTARGTWRRLEVETWVPPLKTYAVQVRLYAPGTTAGIYWDAVVSVGMESLTNQSNPDQAVMVRRIVDYAQDNDVFSHGKSNLRISATDASCPATGVERFRAYQFAEHANIGYAIREFTELDNGLDVSISHTATSRTFHTHYPQKGTDLTASVTIANADLSGLSWSFDGEQAASSVVSLGEGDGPDREEGSAVDTSLFGGKTFELVVPAPTGLPIDGLDDYADEILTANQNPTSVKVSVPNSQIELTGVVDVGDTIDMDVDHGYVVIAGDHRVVAMQLDPATDVVTLELVPA